MLISRHHTIKKNLIKDGYTILFIAHDTALYGAQRCLLDLIINLPNRIKPIVIVPRLGPFVDIIRENGIMYFVIPFRRWWYNKFHIQCISRTFMHMLSVFNALIILRNIEINLVYSNTFYTPVGAILARVISVPHIWHSHEFAHLNYSGNKFDYGLKYSMALVNKFSNLVICTSNAHQDNLSEFIPITKIRRVYNGISHETLSSSKPKQSKTLMVSEIIILIIGSISKNKGQCEAILALNELLNRGQKAKLIIVGGGNVEYIEYLKKLSYELQCNDFIKWEGIQNNINDYLQKADVLIICSQFETFGRVAVEAMSLGCPVIAARSGGILEIIEDGFNGLTYDYGNYSELADKILFLMRNTDLYDQISVNGYETYLKKFKLNNYVDNIINITDEIIDRTTSANFRNSNKNNHV